MATSLGRVGINRPPTIVEAALNAVNPIQQVRNVVNGIKSVYSLVTNGTLPGPETKGLCDMLNAHEQKLVKDGTYEIANVYEIKFASDIIASAKVKNPGAIDFKLTSMNSSDTAAAKTGTNSGTANTNSQNKAVSQGTQILQIIEQVVRNSSYITDQQTSIANTLDVAAPNITNTSSKKNKPTAWFKILVNAVPVSDVIDKQRNDYAYRITYIVTPYAINEMDSSYFPESQFRGVHKLYDYWFTGLNTQVLSYSQKFPTLFQTIAGNGGSIAAGIAALQGGGGSALANNTGDPNNIGVIKTAQPSTKSSQGAPSKANEPAATAADFLYSFADMAKVNIKIVGDPAWLLQGEILGLNEQDMCYDGFYPNGAVCPETQEVVFAINFNSPADYNNGGAPELGTGLIDINSSATQGNSNNLSKTPPQASAAYRAMTVTSTFSKGRFEQELEGSVLKNLSELQIKKFIVEEKSLISRVIDGITEWFTPSPARTPASRTSPPGSSNSAVANAPIANVPGTRVNPPVNNITQPRDSALPVVNRGTQPVTPPKPPTSGGVTVAPTGVNPNPDGKQVSTTASGATYTPTIGPDGTPRRILDGKLVVPGEPFNDNQMASIHTALSPLVLSKNPNPYPQYMIDQYNKQYADWYPRAKDLSEYRDRNLSPAAKAFARENGFDTPAMDLPPNCLAPANDPNQTNPITRTGAAPQQMAPKDQ